MNEDYKINYILSTCTKVQKYSNPVYKFNKLTLLYHRRIIKKNVTTQVV